MARWPTFPYSTHRTGCYGCKRNTPSDGGCGVKGYPCTHWGVDTFTLNKDRSVWAPESGVIVATATGSSPPFSGYGPGVVLMLGDSGWYHLMGHLTYSTIAVKPQQRVAEGAPIGAFDPGIAHCHYEVRRLPYGPSDTNTVNPEQWHRDHSGSMLGKLLLLGGLFVVGMYIARGGRGGLV